MDSSLFWYLAIGAAFIAFIVLDGFDLGTGMLLPFLRKGADSKRAALASIWPFWDGNELWGLIGAGAVLAVFPAAFSSFFRLLYPYAFLLMAALILRPVAFELWFHGSGRKRWERVFAGTGLLIAFVPGCAIGAAVQGLPISAAEPYGASLLAVLQPIPLAFGLFFVAFSLAQGTRWLAHKTGVAEAEGLRKPGVAFDAAAAAIAAIAGILLGAILGGFQRPLFIAAFAACLLSCVLPLAAGKALGTLRTLPAMAVSGLRAALFLCMAGAAQFPSVLRDSADPARSVDAYTGLSEGATAGFLAPIAIGGILLAAAYTVGVHLSFKGRERRADTEVYAEKPGKDDDAEPPRKVLVRCRLCGYIMEADKVMDLCPACGMSAKAFEPYEDRLEPRRRFILSLDMHPVIVHAPQAIAFIALGLGFAAFLLPFWLAEIFATIKALCLILPIAVIGTFLTGIVDGKARFGRPNTPVLKRKMLLGTVFFLSSLGMAWMALWGGLSIETAWILIAINLVAAAASAFLGIIGAKLMTAVFVKMAPPKKAAAPTPPAATSAPPEQGEKKGD